MAKFHASRDLSIRWNGLNFFGAAGTVFRLPDAYVDEFTAEVVPQIIGGVTWDVADEEALIPTLPIAESNVTNLVTDLAAKLPLAGGTLTGAVIGPAFRAKGVPAFDVTAYGATGNGSTDDTAAIASALTAAAGGGIVFFPRGTYIVSATLTLPAAVSLVGVGAAAVLSFTSTNGSSPALILVGGADAVISSIALKDARTYAANPISSVGVSVASNSRLRIIGCNISGFKGGGITAADCTNLSVSGCRVSNIGDRASLVGDGILVLPSVAAQNVTIIGCKLDTCGKHGINLANLVTGATISGNISVGNGDTGIWVAGSFDVSITGNTCENNGAGKALGAATGGQGINVSDSSARVSVSGNVCVGASEQGIVVQNSVNYVSVTGNVTRGNTWAGIAIKTSNSITVSGNESLGNLLDGITVSASNAIAVASNTVDGNSGNGINVTGASRGASVSANVVRDNNQSAGTNSGILVDGTTPADVSITGNAVISTGATKHYFGIRCFAGDNITIVGNMVRGNTTDIGHVETGGVNVVIANNETATGAVISPPALSANANDYNPSGVLEASVIRLSASSSVNVTGIAAGRAGTAVLLQNVGTSAITITHEDVASGPANRFNNPASLPIVLVPNGGVWAVYDGTSARWRLSVPAGIISSGTAFPASPATNSMFFRTDRGLLYFYTGTQWLTVTLYELPFSPVNTFAPRSSDGPSAPVWNSNYQMYLVDWYEMATTNAGTINGSNFYTVTLGYSPSSGADVSVASLTTPTWVSGQWNRTITPINVALSTNAFRLHINFVATGTPPSVYDVAMVTYRLIG